MSKNTDYTNLLSVCISSYNKGKKLQQLVEGLYNFGDPRINVIISDDCSSDITKSCLEGMASKNVSLFYNSTNIGALPNWFETINHGTGKYILQVLDRDYIDLDVLSGLLDYLEENEVGAGYVGFMHSKLPGDAHLSSFNLFEPGERTAALFGGVPMHPTGFLIRRDCWDEKKYRKYFYEENKYGIYPHSYILADIAMENYILLLTKVFCRYVYSQSSKSKFYCNKSTDGFWWEPDMIFKNTDKFVKELSPAFSKRNRSLFVSRIFEDSLYRATVSYKRAIMDKRLMSHYMLECRRAPLIVLLLINFKYTLIYLNLLLRKSLLNISNAKEIVKISFSNASYLLSKAC